MAKKKSALVAAAAASPETKDLVAVEFARAFKFSPDGATVVTYPAGPAEVSGRCAEVAAEAGALVERE